MLELKSKRATIFNYVVFITRTITAVRTNSLVIAVVLGFQTADGAITLVLGLH